MQGIHHVAAVFCGGGEVTADSITVLGALLTGQPPGDLLLDLGRSQIAFGLVGGGWHPQVMGEAQDVAVAVAENFEQQASFAFTGSVAVACGVGQSNLHPLGEGLDQLVPDGVVDGVVGGVAGEVGLVDQAA